AVAHIRLWSSGHTEAIVTTSQAAARRFLRAARPFAPHVDVLYLWRASARPCRMRRRGDHG
ncbi:hypothetical protein, partial [Streptomyces sp. NPDC005407]|uniref:hypothetical protein n=1 Tax=Streptomyces sp. NPDC005407 TaxID=3155340 RepID=UPI0033BDCFE9